MANSVIERRKFPRLNVSFIVKFKIKDNQGNVHTFNADGRDVSAGGLCMEMALTDKGMIEKIYKNTCQMDMEIEVPDISHSIRTQGEVMWMREDNNSDILGVIFKDISESDRGLLSDYVKQGIQ